MSKLPLEVHEVLEEEYVSMYGPLEIPSSDYAKDDIIDERWALAVLEGCKIDVSAGVIDTLNALVAKGAPESLKGSPAITECGISLIANTNDYTDRASDSRRR